MKALGRGSIASWLEGALNVVWVALWIALGCLFVAAVAYTVLTGLVAAGVLPAALLTGGEGRLGGGLNFTTERGMPWQIVTPALLVGALWVCGGLIIVNRLRRLFQSFRSAEPFRKENATHLRVIWITMTTMELGRYALHALTGLLMAVFGRPHGVDASFDLHINLMTWAAVLVLIVLAEVFREGARLREEQDLTV